MAVTGQHRAWLSFAIVALTVPSPLAAQRPAQPPAERIQLIRELAIGGDADRPEYEFIGIGSVAVARSGTMFVAAVVGPTAVEIRTYDAIGTYRGVIGRPGSGPGEYQGVEGLEIVGDTLLVVVDPRQRRVLLFDTTGAFRRSFAVAGPAWSGLHAVAFYTDGTVGVRARTPSGSSTGALGSAMVRYRLTGQVVDSQPLPPVPIGGSIIFSRNVGPRWPFASITVFAVLPGGGLATALTTAYRVDVAASRAARFTIERTVRPVPLEDREREQWDAMNDVGPPRSREVIPRMKPFIRDLLADAEGRIWVSLYTRATERPIPPGSPQRRITLTFWEHNAYDVFDPRGRYLGRVDLRPYSKLVAVVGNRMWVAEELEDGGFSLVRYGLGFPPPVVPQ